MRIGNSLDGGSGNQKKENQIVDSTPRGTTAFMLVYVVCNDLSARLLDLDRF